MTFKVEHIYGFMLKGGICMVYIGIDVSSDKFDVSFYFPDSNSFKSFTFPQSRSGFDSFKSKLIKLKDPFSIALEATGSYSLNLFLFLKDLNFNVILLHPYTVKNILRAFSKSKTDSIDAKNLAFSLFLLDQNLPSSFQPSEDILALRNLVRFRFSLVSQLSNLQKQLQNTLKLNMPEILNFFKHTNSNVLLSLLSLYPSKYSILSHKNEVIEFLS